MTYQTGRLSLKTFLANEVKPALGCTEPGAVALAVARAKAALPESARISSVDVHVSTSIYKNGMAVGIPGARGARGNTVAAALGAICGDASLSLEVLRGCTSKDVKEAERWAADGRCTVSCDTGRDGVYVFAAVRADTSTATCTIEGSHSHIVEVLLDGRQVYASETGKSVSSGGYEEDGFPGDLDDALQLVEEMDEEDAAFLLRGAEMNLAVAEAGYKDEAECAACGDCVQGSRFGKSLLDFSAEDQRGDVSLRIRSVSAAASDARMSGVRLPVMSSAGSGNHGITAILPVYILGRELGRTEREIARAIAISHLATSFVKRRLGRLSPVCGCSVAAGAGAAAGMTALQGGDGEQIACAMSLLLSNLAGMLCDGAKESCALKVGSAAAEAYYASKWALAGQRLRIPQGVFGARIEETVENVGAVSKRGMRSVDPTVIEILDRRQRKQTTEAV